MLNLSLSVVSSFSVIFVANPRDEEQEIVEMQGIEATVGQGGTLLTAVLLDIASLVAPSTLSRRPKKSMYVFSDSRV